MAGRGGRLASAAGARGVLIGGGKRSRTGPRLPTVAQPPTAGRLLAKARQGPMGNRLKNSSLIFDRNSPAGLHSYAQTQPLKRINRARSSCTDCWLII